MKDFDNRIEELIQQARIDKRNFKAYSDCVWEWNKIKGD